MLRALACASLLALGSCKQPAGDAQPAAQPEAKPDVQTAPAAPATAPAAAVDPAAIVAAADRSEDDRKADERRKPVELLEFLELTPGMKVADIGAGFGYTTELLARAVGPTGRVYGQNPKFVLERFAEQPWSERLKKPVMANVERVDREFSDPLPPELNGQLDRVVNVLFYHDFEWQGVDRAAHNKAVLAALKPGGAYILVDHSARAGDGVSQSKTLHRIEESVLRAELEAAGFTFAGEADFLRNPDDPRDFNALPWAGEGGGQLSDRFVHRYRKPGG